PAAIRLQVHRRELPDLAPIVDARLEPTCLFIHAHLQPVLEQQDAVFDARLFHQRRDRQKTLHFVLRGEAHDALDSSPVVPAAIEDHDLARGRHVLQVTLHDHLALLALGRRGQRDDAKDAWTDTFGDRLDGPAFTRTVAAFEHDADLEAFVHDPVLE